MQSKYTGLNKKQEEAMRIRSSTERHVAWDKEQRCGVADAKDEESEMSGHRQRAYVSMGYAATGWHSGLTMHLRDGIVPLDDKTMERLGIPAEGMRGVYEDQATVQQKLEDGDRIERLTGEGEGYAGILAPKEVAAMKYRWERIADVTNEGMMYLWYKNMQENAICYGVPVMPFCGIIIKQGAYGLCTPGMEVKCTTRAGNCYARYYKDALQKTQRKHQR